MFFSGKSKQLPNLAEYLTYAIQHPPDAGTNLGIVGGVVGGVGGLMGGLLGVLGAIGLLTQSGLVIGIVLLNLLAWLVVLGFWMENRRKAQPITEEERIRQQSHKVAIVMGQSMNRRRLHKELPTTASALLEHSAKHWSRTVATLSGPFWTSDALPAHWKAVREQSMAAVNTGMSELLIILAPTFKPDPRRAHWQDMVEDVMEEYVTGPRGTTEEGLPVGYDQARDIAEKLKLVSSAVEKASREVVQDESVMASYRSSAALDMALGELKNIQEAEQELRTSG